MISLTRRLWLFTRNTDSVLERDIAWNEGDAVGNMGYAHANVM